MMCLAWGCTVPGRECVSLGAGTVISTFIFCISIIRALKDCLLFTL
jgi:hypothetical protein